MPCISYHHCHVHLHIHLLCVVGWNGFSLTLVYWVVNFKHLSGVLKSNKPCHPPTNPPSTSYDSHNWHLSRLHVNRSHPQKIPSRMDPNIVANVGLVSFLWYCLGIMRVHRFNTSRIWIFYAIFVLNIHFRSMYHASTFVPRKISP